jgi:DNA-binding IclR family transcriptional regulator
MHVLGTTPFRLANPRSGKNIDTAPTDRQTWADPERWPRIRAGVEQGVKDYQDLGFCISAGEWHTGVHAVGVPAFSADGEQVMAFHCGGPAFLLSREKLVDDLGPRLVRLAKNIETNPGRG